MKIYKISSSTIYAWRGIVDGTSGQNPQMRGLFFTDNEYLARQYARGFKLQYAQLVLENPLKIDYSQSELSLYEIQQEAEKHIRGLSSIFEEQIDNPDGLIVFNAVENSIKHTEYVVFSESQIINVKTVEL